MAFKKGPFELGAPRVFNIKFLFLYGRSGLTHSTSGTVLCPATQVESQLSGDIRRARDTFLVAGTGSWEQKVTALILSWSLGGVQIF